MKAVYPPAQVAPYDSSSFGASPPATRWTKLATRAVSGPAVTPPQQANMEATQPDLLQAILAALDTKLDSKLQPLAVRLQALEARDPTLDNHWGLKDDAFNPNWGRTDDTTANDFARTVEEDANMATH